MIHGTSDVLSESDRREIVETLEALVSGERTTANLQACVEYDDPITVEVHAMDDPTGAARCAITISATVEQATEYTPSNMLGFPVSLYDLASPAPDLAADIEDLAQDVAQEEIDAGLTYDEFDGESAIYSASFLV